MSKPISSIIYRGPSLIDGSPIVVIAIISKRNRKTGDMLQTYIIRADMNPLEASKTGADAAICGSCVHRGKPTDDSKAKQAKERSCYVLLGQGPLNVYRSMLRGIYGEAVTLEKRIALGRGRNVRVGTYGDGAAVPFYVWQELTQEALGHTAYSHQGANNSAAYDPQFFMRSVENDSEARAAWANGERTFRVVSSVADIVKGQEILCPASKEAGAKTTCAACKLCAGASVKAKSIAIPAHGAGKVNLFRKAA
jgi:hypothetical protein